MKHELKCWPRYFDALYQKPFEVRRSDRDFRVDDTLYLREWDPTTKTYTERECTRKVTYILENHDGLTPGYVCLGLAPWQSTRLTDA